MLFNIDDILENKSGSADLFSDKKRAAWKHVHKADARCDFAPNKWRINSRGVFFLSLWKASIYGMPLSQIKTEQNMPIFFAKNISDFIRRFFNIPENSTFSDSWNIITPPPRRHLENNFAEKTAKLISELAGIKYFSNVAKARSKQRVNAIFELVEIPPADNIICFDDIVTTGSTFLAMQRLLAPLNKNVVFITAINNKLS